MAKETISGANVTKFDTGGGDNYIADGYIKSVEKVWIDSVTLTGVMTGTGATLTIAKIPSNKKVTSIDVTIHSNASMASKKIKVGHAGDDDAFMEQHTLVGTRTAATISLPTPGFIDWLNVSHATFTLGVPGSLPHVTSGTTGNITITLDEWNVTTATIRTMVRYT